MVRKTASSVRHYKNKACTKCSKSPKDFSRPKHLPITTVIFDLDGVIVDSLSFYLAIEKEVMASYGVILTDKMLWSYNGTTSRAMFSDLIRRNRLDVPVEKLMKEEELMILSRLDKKVRLIPGVKQLIQALSRAGMTLGVASSSPKSYVNRCLGDFRLEHYFDAVITSDDVTYSKPHPEIFQRCCRELGARPGNTMVIEDAELGIAAARRARMRCIGFQSNRTMDLRNADLIVRSYRQLSVRKIQKLGE
jgi:HAD superfamily hydrolase (TIGR01509 family)